MTTYGYTLRDLQRMAARGRGPSGWKLLDLARWAAPYLDRMPLCADHQKRATWKGQEPYTCVGCLNVLARALGGGDFTFRDPTPEQAEAVANAVARYKQTSEVRPQSDNPSEDSPFHGGDGASGEVDQPAPTPAGDKHDESKSASAPAGTGGHHPGGCGTGESPRPQSQGAATQSPPCPADGEEDGREQAKGAQAQPPTPQPAAEPASEAGPDAGTPDPNDPAAAPDGEDASSETRLKTPEIPRAGASAPEAAHGAHVGENPGGCDRENSSPGEELSSDAPSPAWEDGADGSPSARHAPGGNFLPPQPPRRFSRQDLLLARQAIARFVEQQSGGIDPSPRFDARRLVTELASRRYGISRARRLETQRQRVLVGVDVSGSCSATCQEAHWAAQALAAVDPRVVLWTHSNGYTMQLVVDGKEVLEFGDCRHNTPPEETARQLLSLNLQAAIVMGDWDASPVYAALANAGCRLVWLDSFACNAGAARRSPLARSDTGHLFRPGCRVDYWTRCRGLTDFLTVLKSANGGKTCIPKT